MKKDVRPFIVIGLAAWVLMFILAELNLLVDQVWALALGVLFGILGVPYAIFVAKKDADSTSS